MLEGMLFDQLLVAVSGDFRPDGIMGQIIVQLLQKIIFVLVKVEIFSCCKAVGEIRLVITQKETAAADNIKCPQRDTAADAAQGDVEIDLRTAEHIRHNIIIIDGSHVFCLGKLGRGIVGIELQGMPFLYRRQKPGALHFR